jgi:DNA-binding IclR family transcriptional regulator
MMELERPMSEGRKDVVNAVGKVGRLLACFSSHDRSLTLTALQARTGFPKATTHRLLSSLKELGFIEQDRDRDRYRLGLKLFELGSLYLANLDLHRVAQPLTDRLSKLSGEAVHLCIFDGQLAVFVNRKELESGPHSLIMTIEGAPAYCTGVGKAILAFQDEATIDRVVAAGLKPFTASTIVDADALRSDLAKTRDRGFSIDNCEHQTNVRCVAAPIRNASGAVFASISVTGPPERMSDARLPVLAELVVETADTISERLGWRLATAQRWARE